MPTGIKLYAVAESAFEIWYYGDSRVEINSTSQYVTGWWNTDSNLRIDLVPGDNVTNSTTFTIGSHQDDVLRLQGMPTATTAAHNKYTNHWHYGGSRVAINSTFQCVTGWWNTDGNLRIEEWAKKTSGD